MPDCFSWSRFHHGKLQGTEGTMLYFAPNSENLRFSQILTFCHKSIMCFTGYLWCYLSYSLLLLFYTEVQVLVACFVDTELNQSSFEVWKIELNADVVFLPESVQL